MTGILPAAALPNCLGNHVAGQYYDRARLFGGRYEVIGLQESEIGMFPSLLRLSATNIAVG